MAMYRERDLKELSKEITSDGLGIAGGFLAGGFIGRYTENYLIKTPVDDTSTLTDKLVAWAANNAPKAVLYVLSKHYDAKSEITAEATKALVGSIVYDTIIRIGNKGWNPANAALGGYRVLGENGQPVNVKQMSEENRILRTELNKALQKLASIPRYGKLDPDMPGGINNIADPYERQKRFGSMTPPAGSIDALPQAPAIANRQRKYGAMPDTGSNYVSDERQRKYGAMDAMGFVQEPHQLKAAASFGLL